MKRKAGARGKGGPRADIERVDEEGFHGWRVTVWRNGIEHERRFDEAGSRTPSAAFAAAVRFRDRIVTGAGPALPSNAKTGTRGVSARRVLTSAGRYVMNYTSSWYAADGTRKVRVFSWLKHGKEEALRLAKRAVKEGKVAARRARRLRKKKGKAAGSSVKLRLKSRLDRPVPSKHGNIRRVDHHYFHGYVVTLSRARSRHSKYFSDASCGGRLGAHERATEYYDALLAELPPPVRIHRKSNNSTGIPGVCLVYDRTRSGQVVPRFIAHWHDADGRGRKRSFSTLVHGFGGAESKAIQARVEGVERLIRDRKAMLLKDLENRKRVKDKSAQSRPTPAPAH